MQRLYPIILVVFSASCFGTNILWARMAYADGCDPLTFLLFRFAIASVALVTLMQISGKSYPRPRLTAKLSLLGSIGVTLSTFCYFYALSVASASLVVVLAYTYPALVAILAASFMKQRFTLITTLSLSMTMGGLILTAGAAWHGQVLGIVAALGAAVFFSVYVLLVGDFIRQIGPLPTAAIIGYAATLGFALGAAFWGLKLPHSINGWLAVTASALIVNGLGVMAFTIGIGRLDSTTVSMLCALEVVVALILAMIFLGEQLTPAQYVGATSILGAALILANNVIKSSNPPLLVKP